MKVGSSEGNFNLQEIEVRLKPSSAAVTQTHGPGNQQAVEFSWRSSHQLQHPAQPQTSMDRREVSG